MKDWCLTCAAVILSIVLFLSNEVFRQSFRPKIFKSTGHNFVITSNTDANPRPYESSIVLISNSHTSNPERNVSVKKCGPQPRAAKVSFYKHRKTGAGHMYSFPNYYSNYTLCIPQKNGNRNFGALLYYL
jgi:hypothetical protein